MKRKILALLLACVCLMLPVLMTACSDGSDDENGDWGDPDHPFLPATKDWDGEVFTVLSRDSRKADQAFNIVDIVADEENLSDPIQKAVWERNKKIEAFYNAKIEHQAEADSTFGTMINNTDAYGADFGAFMVPVRTSLNLALKGYILDFNSEVNYIDLTGEWWDSDAIDSLAVKGRSYFALGDINIVDDDATWCVLFNKKLRNKYVTLPNFYSAVEGGTWTTENMKLWASKAIVEGGTPSWETSSTYQYGWYYQSMCAEVLLQASGNTPFLYKDNTGIPTSNLTSLDMIDAIAAIKNLMVEDASSAKWAQNINNISYSGGDVWRDIARGGFMADKALFFMCHCGTIQLIRNMESDFGILPIPKLSESQEKYGNTIQYDNALCYVVPFNTPNSDFTGFMLEAMGYYSSRQHDTASDNEGGSLKAAYYDITLQRKASRDDESWAMLDILFGNRIFDIACAMNVEGMASTIQQACLKSNNEWSQLIDAKDDVIISKVTENIAKLMNPSAVVS